MLGRVLGLLTVGAAIVAGAPAMAADFQMADQTVATTEAVPPGGWNVRITPYAWLTGINGTITRPVGRSDSAASTSSRTATS
jgi:hypothetical protein